MKHWMLSLLIAGMCLHSACIFSEDEPPKTTPPKDQGVTTDMTSDLSPDLTEGDMDKDDSGSACDPNGELPPDVTCCPGLDDPVNTFSDPNHCGGCDIQCGDGNTCDSGVCGCSSGIKPVIIAKDLKGEILMDVVPFWGKDRLKNCTGPCLEMANGYEDIFKDDANLLHYLVLHRQKGDNRVQVQGLRGTGQPIEELQTTLFLNTPTNRGIENIDYWFDIDGVYLVVHFRTESLTEPRSELRLYHLIRKNKQLVLDEPDTGTPIGGQNADGLYGEIVGLGSETRDNLISNALIYKANAKDTKGFLALNINTSDEQGQPISIPVAPIEIPFLAMPPKGTKIMTGFEPRTGGLIVTWWSPKTVMPQPNGDWEGSFFAMQYRIQGDAVSTVTRFPIKINDSTWNTSQTELPRSLPIGESAGRTGAWQLFQLKRQTSFTEAQALKVNPQATVGMNAAYDVERIDVDTVGFSPGIGSNYFDGVYYREFSWIKNDQMEPHGQIVFAHDNEETNAIELKPLSNAKGYTSVRQSIGLPSTLGYVGVYKDPNTSNADTELHFFMTQNYEPVCAPDNISVAPLSEP